MLQESNEVEEIQEKAKNAVTPLEWANEMPG